MVDIIEALEIEPLIRLSKDMKKAALTLTPPQARYLVDLYYQIQGYRIRAGGQERAMTESGEPHTVIEWVFDNNIIMEKDIARALDRYSDGQAVGRWSKQIVGIGPIIAAGMLAHIDITHCPTVGHLWRFAGLDPTVEWLGTDKASKLVSAVVPGGDVPDESHYLAIAEATNRKIETIRLLARKRDKKGKLLEGVSRSALAAGMARRPWNAKLKVLLAFKAGESFVKVQNNEKDVYGKVYAQRKYEEVLRNLRGENMAEAASVLQNKKLGRDTDAYAYYAGCYSLPSGRTLETLAQWWLESGAEMKTRLVGVNPGQGLSMLPPAHIHARARRYAVKLFAAHWHYVAYEEHYGTPPPKPYILTQPGHTHFIQPPFWPM